MENTLESVKLTQKISDEINNQTFHHHYYVLFDLAKEFGDESINYVEIGALCEVILQWSFYGF